MNVRRATEADEVVLRCLLEEFNAEATFTPYAAATFDSVLTADPIALVAEDEGEVVGTVYANAASPDFGYVFGLYVRPAARRRGVARVLMRSIARVLRDEGKQYVVLNVDTPNGQAREFYDRLGFVDAARTLRAEVDSLVDEQHPL